MHASMIILDFAAATFSCTSRPAPSLGEGAKEAGSWEGCTIKEIGLPLDTEGLVCPTSEVVLSGEGRATDGIVWGLPSCRDVQDRLSSASSNR
jgi:hypothetical protein